MQINIYSSYLPALLQENQSPVWDSLCLGYSNYCLLILYKLKLTKNGRVRLPNTTFMYALHTLEGTERET